jgi:hypothetical protein
MTSVATTDRSHPSPTARASTAKHVAWMPRGELDTHEWAAAGRRIGAVGRSIQWLLGDWITYGNEKFGERYARASKITGYDTQTLMNMVYVASRFPISRRRENLSWSHHETLAALVPDEQDQWLDQASTHRWSVSDLRMMLRMSRKEDLVKADEGGVVAGAEGPDSNGGQKSRLGRRRPATKGLEAGETREPAPSDAVVKCPRCGEEVSMRGGRS